MKSKGGGETGGRGPKIKKKALNTSQVSAEHF